MPKVFSSLPPEMGVQNPQKRAKAAGFEPAVEASDLKKS